MNNVMIATGITLLAVLSWIRCSHGQTTPPTNETLDQGTVEMLSNILESLDTFRNDRLRDLERIRITTPDGNSTKVTRLEDMSQTPDNSSVSEHIRALKEGIMGHNPVKKTFGYKVTVYTSPIGENGKDAKPVLVTQYVGGDMRPPTMRRADELEDLQESANHPDRQLVHSSASAHLPIQVSVVASGGGEGSESSAEKGAKDHDRKTEHSESSEKGHQNGHNLHTRLSKGHDHEKHSAKHDEHHKETEKESHRHDTEAHDKGGATQQGIRERTEIEYYEREHFLDTEYDKAKSGHDKTHGVKEHESHNDHDSHQDKKVHAKEDAHGRKEAHDGSVGQGAGIDAHSHYTPPLPVHPHVVHKDHLLHEDSHALQEDKGLSRLHHSEESKGHKEHNHERDHQSEEKDQGYLDKDKGRRKEGYRERGYKITAEREYFLNDAHHDKGAASHTSGHKLKDQEGAAHGAKEGERDRGFVKEEKDEEAHDAAYDAKEKRYYDGEAHAEGFASEKTAASSGGEKKQKEEVIPLAPPVVNYIEPDQHHSPLYPLPIVYSSSNDGAQAVLAYPPQDLPPPNPTAHNSHSLPASYNNRQIRNREEDVVRKQQQPIGGYDDDDVNLDSTGYRGHASYKRRNQNPLVASIRDNVRKDVHSKPPSYSKEEASAENSVPSSDNPVRFPDDSEEEKKYPKESVDETDFHREEPPQTYKETPKFDQERRRPDSQEVYFQKGHPDQTNTNEQHRQITHKDVVKFDQERRRPDSKEVYFQKSHPDQANSNEQYRQIPHKDVAQFEQERRRPDSKEVYFQKETLSQPDPTNPHGQYRLIPTKKDVVYLEESKKKRPGHGENVHNLHLHRPREQNSRLLYVQGAQNADKLLRTVDRSVYPHTQGGTHPTTMGELIQEIARYPQSQEAQRYPQRNTNNNAELTYSDLHQIYNPNPSDRQLRSQQGYRSSNAAAQQQPQTHQQQLIAKYNQLIQNAQQQAGGETAVDHRVQDRPDLLHLQQHQQHQIPRTVTALEQLQQQTKPPFSPVVLLSRGPQSQKQNQAVDVWYTRPRS